MAEVSIDKSAKEIRLPSEMTELQPYMFSGCSELEKVQLPLSLKEFPEGLFQGCSSLKDIPFRAGITEIHEKTFEGCSSLKSIVFPDTINAIRSRACADCTSLTAVVLPPKMYALADDAFEGCNKIAHIRIDESNKLFYINENDGCLYERNVDGDDVLKIRLASVASGDVGFYKENVDDETEPFFTDEQVYEEDDTFYSEIGEDTMDTENNVDDMLADIMGQEKERNEVTEDIGVSDQESAVLSEMMDVMKDNTANKGAAVSNDELANLFDGAAEQSAPADDGETEPENPEELTGKVKILVDSVQNYQLIVCEDPEEPRSDADLFVVSEKDEFSDKLVNCAKKVARIQDFKRIILLSGIPVDNDEFVQFFFHFISQKNIIVACEAEGPSTLSDYCKTICEQSRISLDKTSLADQHKKIGVKNNDLIKIIIRDVE